MNSKKKQTTLNGGVVDPEPLCTCGVKKPYDLKYHYPECPYLRWTFKQATK